MTKLSSISIVNYRSIKSADLTLGDITAVVGASNQGKSNCIRALRDWAYGARGQDMLTLGTKSMLVSVMLEADPRLEVFWEKYVTKTSYRVLNRDSGEETSFEKAGLSVPTEVTGVSGIRSIQIDDGLTIKPNLAEQGESWFLLSKSWTGTMVSKVIAKISGIEDLLLSVRRANLQVSNSTSFLKTIDESISLESQRAAEIKEWAPHAIELIDEAENRSLEVSEAEDKVSQVVAHIRQIGIANTRIDQVRAKRRALETALKRYEDLGIAQDHAAVEKVLGENYAIEVLQNRVSALQGQWDEINAQCEGLIRALETMSTKPDLVCPLCGDEAHRECRESLAAKAAACRES